MIWGINDFDETYPLPYTFDLVRLATSAHLAIAAGHLKLGEKDACEAKALAPSACAWAAGLVHPPEILCQDILNRSVRAMDPFVKLQGRWIVRRLAPDCSRIELASLAPERDEARLLHAMGWETANIHRGSPKVIKAVRRDVQKRAANWLYDAAEQMVKATTSDWENWKTASD